jgi:hypothetical protein
MSVFLRYLLEGLPQSYQKLSVEGWINTILSLYALLFIGIFLIGGYVGRFLGKYRGFRQFSIIIAVIIFIFSIGSIEASFFKYYRYHLAIVLLTLFIMGFDRRNPFLIKSVSLGIAFPGIVFSLSMIYIDYVCSKSECGFGALVVLYYLGGFIILGVLIGLVVGIIGTIVKKKKERLHSQTPKSSL